MRRAYILILFVLTACGSQTPIPPSQTALYAIRLSPPALIEFSSDYESILRELPLSIPQDCGLYNAFPSPSGDVLAIELSCSFGQTVLFLDLETAALTPAFTAADSSLLAWTADGKSVYLRVDSAAQPRILRVDVDGRQRQIPITELTYDMAAAPDGNSFTFTFSRGLGFGSEIWSAKGNGNVVQLLHADAAHYISFARFSPDGKQIAFLKIPDSQTPFTVGELWVMNADGSNPRRLADADAGHGYAANWSPDGSRIAFVKRENPEDENADRNASGLISSIHIVDVENGLVTQLTNFGNARAETPVWSPNGNVIAFQVVLDGRMGVQIVDLPTGGARPLITESTCCPAWMRK